MLIYYYPAQFQHVILIVSFINSWTESIHSELQRWSRRLARVLVHILWNYTIMVKTVMIILINVLSKFLNCLKSLKPQWTVHITSQLQWLKLIYQLIWSQLFSSKSAGFSSSCCLVCALHPIKCHHPQRTVGFNKAWSSTSLLVNGQILCPLHAELWDGASPRSGDQAHWASPHCSFCQLVPKSTSTGNNRSALQTSDTWECSIFTIIS